MRFPVVLGCGGSLATSIAAPTLVGGEVRWWFHLHLAHTVAQLLLYAGMVSMVIAWLALADAEGENRTSARQILLAACLWALPLLLAPPLFSRDVYSYLAQGTIVHLGLDPYRHAPAFLAQLGHARVTDAVSPFWRHSTAPYGPLFVAAAGLIAAATGSNLVLGAIAMRLLEGVGMVLLALYLPRLARGRVTPARALWLVLLNPLFLLQVVAPGHNDLLMVGLMIGGIALARESRFLLGIVLCALAATIKLPALVAVVFLAVAYARSRGTRTQSAWCLAKAGLLSAITIVIVSLGSGLGLDWLSGSVFSTPARVHLAITPSTALGWTTASLLHAASLKVSTSGLESALGIASLAVVAVSLLALLRDTRLDNLLPRLGCGLLVIAFGGPAAWPWYFVWGLAVLAAWPLGRWVAPLAAGSVAAAFVVKADGILALPLQSAPAVLCVYLALVVLGYLAWRRGLLLAAHRAFRPARYLEGDGLAQIR